MAKMILLVDLDTEANDGFKCTGEDLVHAVDSVLGRLGNVKELSVYEEAKFGTVDKTLEAVSLDIKEGHVFAK